MTSSSSLRKLAVVLLLGILLGAPWAAAAAPHAVPPPSAVGLGDLLARVWRALTSLWGDEGCTIDPSGWCKGATVPTVPPPTLDAGCTLDPNGRCLGVR